MDGWMDGWTDGLMDGSWKDRQTDGWPDQWDKDRWMDVPSQSYVDLSKCNCTCIDVMLQKGFF